MSHIHFKSVYNINYDKVTFDSSSLTLQQLKNLIAEKSKLSKKLDFDLEISNADTNQVYQENDVILKNTRVLVKRVIKNSITPLRQKSPKPGAILPTSQSTINLPNSTSGLALLEKSKSVSPSSSITNLKENANVADKKGYDSLAPLTIPSKPLVYVEESDKTTQEDIRMDEKAKLESILATSMTSSPTSETQTRLVGFAKSWQKQASPINRPIPPGYVCVICRKPGHLKQFCPEAANLPKPEDRPKYPSGIPRTNLRPAQPGEKFAMLGPEGYVVTEIDKQAAKVVKKDRFLFEDDDFRSEKIETDTKIEEIPKELKCPFGEHILKDAVLVPCCGHFICCDECIREKIVNEETIVCPNKECDQELGPMVSITPEHETRKKVQDYLAKSKREKIVSHTGARSDAFFDMIMSDLNGKEENEPKSEPISPVQDSNISSSEILSQLITASADTQNLPPVPLPTPPITPTVDLTQVRAQTQAYHNYQYKARLFGQKTYSGQVYPPGGQSFYPYMPRGNFYGQIRPRFVRPPVNMYAQMPFYPSIEPVPGAYQNVMSESQFYEYQESLKNEKEYESRVDKKDDRYKTSRSRERYKRSRSKSRSRYRDSHKPRHRSKSRSRGRHRSRSRSKRKYKRSKSRQSEKKYKKRSRSRSSSRKSKDRKKSETRSRSISLSDERGKRHKSSKKKEK